MRCITKTQGLTALLMCATSVSACQNERHSNRALGKRQITRQSTFGEDSFFAVVSAPRTAQSQLNPEESVLVESISNTTLDEWSYYYTHGNHIAGKNRTQAQWTADKFTEYGLNSSIVTYNVFLNYPVNKSLTLTQSDGSVYEPSLEEAVLSEDETTSYPDRLPTFHGYSASGSATAEYVYIGRGQQVDFERLVELGVPLEGKIAIARYGGPFRGLKVKNSQDYGMLATVIFTDPGDDGNMTEANGYAAYPHGPARNPTSVQRGSVQFLSTYPGDPTTPGYPSKEGVPRANYSSVVPRIPSIPISYQDAIPILAALDGHGTAGEAVNRTNWVGALNVSYSTGPAPGATLSLSNQMDDQITDIWNAIGVINGTIADETIVIGNHRDAWIVGGAADPNSGTAVLVELSKAFGKLLAQGWRPKRNIVLASWDAEEYGLVGSTEWVEEYIPWLTETTISYLNIDVGSSGPHPDISASPELHTVAIETMKKVLWRDTGRTMYEEWYDEFEGDVGVLGSGSDYTAFLHNGIGSIDMGSGGGPDDPVYHYHSNYDSYHWMATYGDPGFLSHQSMAQYLTLLAYNLASSDLIPFDLPNYSTQLEAYFEALGSTIKDAGATGDLDVSPLRNALDTFASAAKDVKAQEQQAQQSADPDLLSLVNHKYRDFQRGFVSQGGLPNREFYKHLIFAPGLDTGYAATTLPGITEAVEAGNLTLAAEFVDKTAKAITVAANILKT